MDKTLPSGGLRLERLAPTATSVSVLWMLMIRTFLHDGLHMERLAPTATSGDHERTNNSCKPHYINPASQLNEHCSQLSDTYNFSKAHMSTN